jgi:hypothetical protein
MLKHVVLSAVVAAATLTPIAANADTFTAWSSTGGGCSAADTAVGLFTVGAGSTKFTGTQTGTFQLYCAVTSLPFEPDTLSMTFADTSGSTTNSYVQVSLYRMSTSTGSITQIATLTSNDGGSSNGTPFVHTFDFESYFYYIRVDIHRTSSSYVPILYGVRLYNNAT